MSQSGNIQKLHVFVAAHQKTKAHAHKQETALHRASEKRENYAGLSRRYESIREGDAFSPSDETKEVAIRGEKVFAMLEGILREEIDLNLTVRTGNQNARADVKIDGEVILQNMPATFLLDLERQIDNFRKLVASMPVLDPSVRWSDVEGEEGLKASPESRRAKTRKVQEPIVLYDATPEHPAQTQLITKDVIIGHFVDVQFSGALSGNRKREVLARIDKLAIAVRAARIEANAVEVHKVHAADAIFKFIFGA